MYDQVNANKTDLKTVLEIHEYIGIKANLSNFYLCPHDDIDECECRKPKIGLLVQAAEQLNIDLNFYCINQQLLLQVVLCLNIYILHLD